MTTISLRLCVNALKDLFMAPTAPPAAKHLQIQQLRWNTNLVNSTDTQVGLMMMMLLLAVAVALVLTVP
jgi:hypothetical protein